MKKSLIVGTAIVSLFASPASAADLMVADFTFTTNSAANVKAPFNALMAPSTAYTGSLVFDAQLAPSSGSTGFYLVPFSAVLGVSPATVLNITLGSLSFDLSDNLDSERPASLVYNNGSFYGINFLTDFDLGGTTYRLRTEGNVFNIRLGSTTLVTGRIGGLTNIEPYVEEPPVAAVPEPATWAMMLLGFGLVGGAIRSANRRQKVTVSYA